MLNANENQANEMDESMREFVSIISHDLKAPLRGISTIANWLERDYAGKLDSEFDENIKLISDRAKILERMISSLANYVRATNELDEIVEINPQEVIQEILDSVDHLPSYTINVEENIPLLRYPRSQFYHVIQNLLLNAIKYVNRADAYINISCDSSHVEYFQFCVSDNGPGIDPDEHQRIFKIFQTLDYNKETRETSGVGLSIVKKIVENFGGKVWVESTLGKGSSFYFTVSKSL